MFKNCFDGCLSTSSAHVADNHSLVRGTVSQNHHNVHQISPHLIGKTKVFLKDAHDLYLEQERDRELTRKIVVLQKTIRGWRQRRRFLAMKASAVKIQAHWRGYVQKKKYQNIIRGYARLQAVFRARKQVRAFENYKK